MSHSLTCSKEQCSFKITTYEIISIGSGQQEAGIKPEVLSFWSLHCLPYWAQCSM
jgi:hypothetical protein